MASDADRVKIRALLETQVDAKSLNQASKKIASQTKRSIESLSNQTDMTKLIRANMPSQKAFRSYEAPLGKINGLVNDFDKSLAASNARVLAFGASVASVGAVERAFSSLLNSTIQVQKSLKELQVISEVSNSEIAEYSNKLFDIARNTATSFSDASKAALEFSRQGLSMNQILERTNDTMIMMRITGISLDEAIGGLTATINAFSNEDLSSSEILNALSAIDLAAAASTDGIIKGMARSASAARSAGVSFRELASFIATLQEVTGLQGGVLGNSAKSIFTRVIDPSKLELLKNYNVKIESDNGELLETMDILKNMARTIKGVGNTKVFNDKSELVKFMKEMSGLYQIDKLTALINDLGTSLGDLGTEKLEELDKQLASIGISLKNGNQLRDGAQILQELSERIKETSDVAEKNKLNDIYQEVAAGVSRYDKNLINSNKSSDEAYRKNELLNQTLDAQIQKLKTTGIELGSAFGNTAFLDDLTSGLLTVNNILEKITEGVKGEGSLAFLENIVQGIGSVLTGPGLVLAIATIGKGISYMAKQTKDSWISFMDLNKASQRQIQYEQLLNNLYQSNADIQAIIADKTISRASQAQKVVSILDAEVARSQTLAKIYAEIAATMTSMTTLNVSQANIGAYQKGKFVKNKASGDNAFVREQKAIQMGIGGARKNASPVIMNNFPLDGIKQTVVANSDEVIVDAGNGKYKILNRNQVKELTKSKNFAKGMTVMESKTSMQEHFIVQDLTKDLIKEINNLSIAAENGANSVKKVADSITETSNGSKRPTGGNTQSALDWRRQQGGGGPPGFQRSGRGGKHYAEEDLAKMKDSFDKMDESMKKSTDSTKKMSRAISRDSVEREKSLGNLIKWTMAASFLNGALLKVDENSSAAAKTLSYFGEVLQSLITLQLAKSAFGFGTSRKDIMGSFTGFGRSAKAGYLRAKRAGWGEMQWGSGGNALANNTMHNSANFSKDIIGNVTKGFKGLGPLLLGVAKGFGRLIPAVAVATTVWSILPDSVTDVITSTLGKALGFIDTPAEKAAKALKKLADESLKVAAGGAIKSQSDILDIVKETITKYNVAAATDDKSVKEEGTFSKLFESKLKSSFFDTEKAQEKLYRSFLKDLASARKSNQENESSRPGMTPLQRANAKQNSFYFPSEEESTLLKGSAAALETLKREMAVNSFIENNGAAIYRQLFTSGKIKEAETYYGGAVNKAKSNTGYFIDKAHDEFKQSENYQKALEKGGKAASEVLNRFTLALYDLSRTTAKELGITEETFEELQKRLPSLNASLKRMNQVLNDTIKTIEILRKIPSEADLSKTSADIYGSPAEKLIASYNVSLQTQARNTEDAILAMRKEASEFISKSYGRGYNTENGRGLLAQEIVSQANTADEIKNAIGIITKWTNKQTRLSAEQELDVSGLLSSIDFKEKSVAAENFGKALDNSVRAIREFDKYLSETKFKEVLSEAEIHISKLSDSLKNLESDSSVNESILSAISKINPNIEAGTDFRKALLEYRAGNERASIEQQKYFAELERDIVERISNLQSPQDRESLFDLAQKTRSSEGGFSNIESVGNLVEKLAIAEENSLREQRKAQLSLALQEIRSATLQYKAANMQLEAAKINVNSSPLVKAKETSRNILPQAVLNVPDVKKVLGGNEKYERNIAFSEELEKKLERRLSEASRMNTPEYVGINARQKQVENILSTNQGKDAAQVGREFNILGATIDKINKALSIRTNQQLEVFAGKIKQASDSITLFKLNLDKEDVDLESQILGLPEETQEVIRNFAALERAGKELALSQMEVARANLQHRQSLLESTQQIQDQRQRAKVLQSFSSGASNDTIRKQIASALAEQDVQGLKSTDVFNKSVNDFSGIVKIYDEAVRKFDAAVRYYEENKTPKREKIEDFSPRDLTPRVFKGIGEVNAKPSLSGAPDVETGLLPYLTPNSNGQYYPDNIETAVPASTSEELQKLENNVKSINEELPPLTQDQRKLKEEIEKGYLAQGKDNEALEISKQAQISYQKSLNEAQKHLDRFAIATKQAITAATAYGRYQAERIGKIDEEGPKSVPGYENMSFSKAQKEAAKGFLKAEEAGNKSAMDKYTDDINKITAELNKRTEFKTFNEGWNESIAQMSDDAKRLEENMGKMIGTIKDGFVDVFTDAITGAKSFEDAMTDMVQNVANQIIKHGLNSLLSNMFSGIGKMGSGGQNAVDASQSGMGGGIFSWISSLFAEGGQVVGGSGVRDDVPALLTGGEYVLKKDVVSRVGKDYLDMLNSGKVSKFATGGYVKGRNSERWYLDNGGYPTDTSKSNNGAGGFYSPGKYGYGSIVGRNNLKSFATQSFTSGQYDVIKQNETGGVIGLENESWRISAYGRNADTVENQTTEADKREAFNLADQEQKQADALEKERKKRKKSLWKSIIGAGAMIGLSYITGGIGANSSWGLANLLGGSDSSLGSGIQTFQGAFGNGPRGEDQTNILRGLFGMKKLEKQKASGGSITSGTSGRDTTPINAMQGEYVISRNAARNIGTPFLDALNNNRVSFDNGANQSSGPVGMDFSKLIDKFDEMISVVREAFEGSTGNITINVTENSNGSSEETQQGQTTEENNRLAQRIKEVVRATILEEKRVGGMLNSTRA